MKRLPYTIAVTLALIAVGMVVVGFLQSNADATATRDTVLLAPDTSNALPTAISGFSDIEHIPIYPNATVTFTSTEPITLNHITYQVEERMDKVADFYKKMLPEEGWQRRSGQSGRNLYNWTEPEGRQLWGIYLRVDLELTLDETRTAVYLEYGRYPITEEGLPTYPDAQHVSVNRSIIERDFPSGKTPVRATDITYLSGSSPQDIATFYTNSMQEYGWLNQGPGWSTQEYGWFPFDDPGSWEGYSPVEGLYFVAWRPGWGEDPSVSSTYHLLATAEEQEDGESLVKLHVEEWEDALNF